jgi:membrane protease YdiL (CAAX protease family)
VLSRLGVALESRAVLRNHTWDGVLFYLGLPVATIVALRQNPLKWGLGTGRWKWTLGLTVVGAVGSAALLLLAVRLPVFQRYYDRLGPPQGALWPWIGLFVIDMFVWEFFFRGFMLFGLEPAFGEMAVYIQMIPFAIAHIGKPEIETLSSIAGGILIGYIARYCRSFWPAFVLHVIIGLTMYTL